LGGGGRHEARTHPSALLRRLHRQNRASPPRAAVIPASAQRVAGIQTTAPPSVLARFPLSASLGGNDAVVFRRQGHVPTGRQIFGDPCRRPSTCARAVSSRRLLAADVSCKTGTRVPTGQPWIRKRAAFGHPRSAISGPVRVSAPSFPDGSTPSDRHGTPYSSVRPASRTTLLRLARRRSDARASWISAPNGLPSRRRPLPRQVLDPNVPVASSGAAIVPQPGRAGISPISVNRVTAGRAFLRSRSSRLAGLPRCLWLPAWSTPFG